MIKYYINIKNKKIWKKVLFVIISIKYSKNKKYINN